MAHFSENEESPRAGGELAGARVIDTGGNTASIVAADGNGPDAQVWVRLEQGAQVLVPVKLLERQEDGVYRLPFAFRSAGAQGPVQMSFPVMEEELHVAKRVVDTGRGVRIHKTIAEREQVVEQDLRRDELQVEHVAIGRLLDDGDVPQTRYEGDTLVVPVLEEVLVVQKQLLLKEEVRVTRRRRQETVTQTVLLRTEQIEVERFDEGR